MRRVVVRELGGAEQLKVEPVDELTGRCVRLAGGSVFSYTADPAELRRRASAVVEGIGAGWLRVGDATAYDLGRAADAHRDIEGRGTRGKRYLTP